MRAVYGSHFLEPQGVRTIRGRHEMKRDGEKRPMKENSRRFEKIAPEKPGRWDGLSRMVVGDRKTREVIGHGTGGGGVVEREIAMRGRGSEIYDMGRAGRRRVERGEGPV